MDDRLKKYLPIGSVVILKNGTKRIMITGYVSIDMEKKDKVYDYIGCMFPEGVISTRQSLLFNHDDIEKVFCLGFSDEEQKEYMKKLKETLTSENIEDMLKKVKES